MANILELNGNSRTARLKECGKRIDVDILIQWGQVSRIDIFGIGNGIDDLLDEAP
jgi:hypothetical protein